MQLCEEPLWSPVAQLLLSRSSAVQESSSLPPGLLVVPKTHRHTDAHGVNSREFEETGGEVQPLSFGSLLREIVRGSHRPQAGEHSALVFAQVKTLAAQCRAQSSSPNASMRLVEALRSTPVSLPCCCELNLQGTASKAAKSTTEANTSHIPLQALGCVDAAYMLRSCIKSITALHLDACKLFRRRLVFSWGAAAGAGPGPGLETPIIPPMTLEADLELLSTTVSSPAPASPVYQRAQHGSRGGDCGPWRVSDLNPPGGLDDGAHNRDFSLSLGAVEAVQAVTAPCESHGGLSEGSGDASGSNTVRQSPLQPGAPSTPSRAPSGRRRPNLKLLVSPDARVPQGSAAAQAAEATKDSALFRQPSQAHSVASGISSIGSVRSQSQQDALLNFDRSSTADMSFELSPTSVKSEEWADEGAAEPGGGVPPTCAGQHAEGSPDPVLQLDTPANEDHKQPSAAIPAFRLPLLAAKPNMRLAKRAQPSKPPGRLQTPAFRGLRHLQEPSRPRTAPATALQITPMAINPVTVKDSLRVARHAGGGFGAKRPTESQPAVARSRPSPRVAKQSRLSLNVAMAGASAPLHQRGGPVLAARLQQPSRPAVMVREGNSDVADAWMPRHSVASVLQSKFLGLSAVPRPTSIGRARSKPKPRGVHFALST